MGLNKASSGELTGVCGHNNQQDTRPTGRPHHGRPQAATPHCYTVKNNWKTELLQFRTEGNMSNNLIQTLKIITS